MSAVPSAKRHASLCALESFMLEKAYTKLALDEFQTYLPPVTISLAQLRGDDSRGSSELHL